MNLNLIFVLESFSFLFWIFFIINLKFLNFLFWYFFFLKNSVQRPTNPRGPFPPPTRGKPVPNQNKVMYELVHQSWY